MTEQSQRPINEAKVRATDNTEVVYTYLALLDKIWQRLLPILGLFTTRVIMKRALRLTARQYPYMGDLNLSDEGIKDLSLRAHMNEQSHDILSQGFEALLTTVFELLIELTGEKVVYKLFADEFPALQNQRSKPE